MNMQAAALLTNPEALTNGLFVVIGAIIATATSIATTLIGEKIKNKNEVKRLVRERKEQLYIALTGVLYELIDSSTEHDLYDFNLFLTFYLKRRVEIYLYSSNNVRDKIEILIKWIDRAPRENSTFHEATRQKCLKLVNDMRTELIST